MNLKKELISIVGPDNVSDDPEHLETYSRDQSFEQPHMPDIVVKARSTEQVQQIVRLANKTRTPVTPYSSGFNLHGAAIPAYGGIVLDLSGMDTIVRINEKDLYAIIEPGVTYEKLQNELEKKGMRIMVPFGVPAGRSVITSYLERDIVMASTHLELGNYLTHDTELVLPDGEIFRTGCWNLGGRPGGLYGPGLNNLYRLWTGAQGTLGIFTKIVISIQHLSPVRKFYFIPFEKMSEIPEAVKQIQRKEIGLECFGINRFNLACLLNDDWEVPKQFPAHERPSKKFTELQQQLPAWTVIIGIAGMPHLPEEWVAMQQETLEELCHKMGLSLDNTLPGFPDIEKVFLRESLRPWGILKKFNFKGAVHDLSFKCPLKKLPELEKTVRDEALKSGYATEHVGGYFAAIERGRAIHCEFDLHCRPSVNGDENSVRRLWEIASSSLLDKGALFDRPYGYWAEIVYDKAPQYHAKLKQLKAEMDPLCILNPGRLGLKRSEKVT